MPSPFLFISAGLLWSFLPLLAVSGGDTDPFAWGLVFTVAAVAAELMIATVCKAKPWQIMKLLLSRAAASRSDRWLWGFLGLVNLQLPLFVMAAHLSGAELASVVYETAPVFVAAILAFMKWGRVIRFRHLTLTLGLATAGIILVGLGKGAFFSGADLSTWMIATGLLCAVTAAVLGAGQVVATLQLGAAAKTPAQSKPISGSETMVAVVATACGQIIGLPILLLFSWLHPASINSPSWLFAAITGSLLSAPYVFLSRLGNMRRSGPSVNLWLLTTPCAAVLWLWLFRGLELARPVWFFSGAALIVVSGALGSMASEKATGNMRPRLATNDDHMRHSL